MAYHSHVIGRLTFFTVHVFSFPVDFTVSSVLHAIQAGPYTSVK
jgi:hypothetical protein